MVEFDAHEPRRVACQGRAPPAAHDNAVLARYAGSVAKNRRGRYRIVDSDCGFAESRVRSGRRERLRFHPRRNLAMRYLVTGGAGFIGSNTVDELVRRGHHVAVLDDLSTGKERNLACVRDKIEFIHGSITDLPTLERACREIDYVLHLGARTSVPRSVADPLETNRVNVDGTLNVLVAARDAGVRRVVFAGSSSVYGETPTLPKREDMPPAPISPYGVTKLVGELYGQVFHRIYGVEIGRASCR